MSFSYRVSCA